MRFYQKLIAKGLFLTGLFGCGSGTPLEWINKPKEEKKIGVEYFDFSKMQTFDIPDSKIDIPKGLESLLKYNLDWIKVSEPDRFRQEVLKTAEELGYSQWRISVLLPHEAVKLSSDIVGRKIDYHLVDQDFDFIKEHGVHLPKDIYFYLGKGDCDKYADLTTLIYNILKEINISQKIKNVYVTDNIGGEGLLHAWNSVLIAVSSEKILCSHIDPTFADNKGEFEGSPDHVNQSYFKFKFLNEIGNYNQSNQLIDELLNSEKNKNKKAYLFSRKAFNHQLLEEHMEAGQLYEKAGRMRDFGYAQTLYIDNACKSYHKLGHYFKVIELTLFAKENKLENAFCTCYPSILATAVKSCRKMGNAELEKRFLEELLAKFPDDVYAKEFK